jgi:hypothetical protein
MEPFPTSKLMPFRALIPPKEIVKPSILRIGSIVKKNQLAVQN